MDTKIFYKDYLVKVLACHGTNLTRCYSYAYALHGLGVAMTEHRPDP